ncbi:uncharacterized protein LOC141855021 isoform X2 [Brevipalpus obovatus]|uniref:uncharacterized protein LOC141855021 isoform X2 n=1 Tax=Brevipalpus obovatus TaxID=246614 RepID=UPI003D9E6A4B
MQDLNSDADFDAYWEDEARNPNRNRIRIGRQYQATIPPLIKPGENDGRKLENLETLRWNPEDQPADLELAQYLSVAKAVYLISRLLDAEDNPPSVTTSTSDSEMDIGSAMEEEMATKETSSTTPPSTTSSISSVPISSGAPFSTLNKPKLLPSQPKSQPKAHPQLDLSLSHTGENKSSSSTKEKSTIDDQYDDIDKDSDANWEYSTEYLRTALKGLLDFIISIKEQSQRKDIKSTVPNTTSETQKQPNFLTSSPSNQQILNLPKSKWTPTEIHLFTIALEFCGKNFSAIKKEFLPWRSVKSIIEFYYLGLSKDSSSTSSTSNPPSSKKSPPSKQSTQCTNTSNNPTATNSSTTGNQNSDNGSPSCEGDSSHPTSSPQSKMNADNDCASPSGMHCASHGGEVGKGSCLNSIKCETNEENDKGCLINGVEVKAIKGRPVSPKSRSDQASSASNLGSLKFYKDGHLVLKLNAKQEEAAHKCHWVESQDTPRLPKPGMKGNGLKPDSLNSGNHRSNNHQGEDLEDNSLDSSDVESQASSESSNLPTITTVNNPKKAKVRVEDCFVPLSSCNSISTSSATSRDHISSSSSSSSTTTTTTTFSSSSTNKGLTASPVSNTSASATIHSSNHDPQSLNEPLSSLKRPIVDSSTKSISKPLDGGDLKKRTKTTSSSATNSWSADHSKNLISSTSCPSPVSITTTSSKESKWYMTGDDRAANQPPVAHAASSRQAHTSNKPSSSSFHPPNIPLAPTKPVDLTRKTCPSSPRTKSSFLGYQA